MTDLSIIAKELKDQILRIEYIESQLTMLDNNENPCNLPPTVKISLVNSRITEIFKLGEMVLDFDKQNKKSTNCI